MAVVMDADRVSRSLTRIAHEIVERNRGVEDLALVGIRARGVPLAARLAAGLRALTGVDVPTGALDITLYRDDLMRHAVGPQPVVRRTEIPFSIDDRLILLVDDVLYTGRTIRAALDALIDFGRPRAIQLVALVDRGHRELPIRADYVGRNIPDVAAAERAGPAGRARRPRRSGGGRMTTATTLRSRHLLGIEDLERGEIDLILETALAMKEVGARPIKKVPTLRGRTVVNLFFEASTRTRMSFELAEKRLSADTLGMTTAGSSVTKGETLSDTARTIEAMAPDLIVMRHASSGAPHQLARICRAGIINAGDGTHEHPTQALLDAFTIRERKGRLDGVRVAIVGDLEHSRVLRSNLFLLTKMGASVVVCSPPTLRPLGLKQFGVDVTSSIDEAVTGADVVMMLRVQHERMRGPLPAVAARVLHALRPDAGTHAPRRAGRHRHASRADEPRRRNRFRGRRRAVVRDSRPGRQRRGRPHGRALSARRGRRMTVDAVQVRSRRRSGRRAGTGDSTCSMEDGLVARVGRDIPAGSARVVELPASCVMTPGLIDIHVHLREPGQEHKETIATGTAVGRRRRLHGRGLHAEHGSDQRQRVGHAVHREARGRNRRWRACTRLARCRSDRRASNSPRSATCARPAAWRLPTTAGRWRRRC